MPISVNKILAEIQKELHEIRLQQGLFEGRLTSEQGNMTRHVNEINKKLDKINDAIEMLKLWRSNMEGRILVTAVVVAALISVAVAIFTK